MTARLPSDSLARTYEVAIVGNDMLLAALPARPVQLAHAVLACGFDLVVPVSWGEELIAHQALRSLAEWGPGPAIFCACPSVRARLLSAGDELSQYLVPLIPGPVATARYLRASQPTARLQITFLGTCPGGEDPSIDARLVPGEFLRHMQAQGVAIHEQPTVFDSVVPPDRRRHYSLAGGCPSREMLQAHDPERRLVTLEHPDFVSEIADRLLRKERVLIDPAPVLGCACCSGGSEADHGELAMLEPPRAATPVVGHEIEVSLDASDAFRLQGRDAASRTPVAAAVQRAISRAGQIAPGDGIHAIEHARRKVGSRRPSATPAHGASLQPAGAPAGAPVRGESRSPRRVVVDAVDRTDAPVVVTEAVGAPGPVGSPEAGAARSGTMFSAAFREAGGYGGAEEPPSRTRKARTNSPGTWHLARASSHVRINTGEGPALPRAYVAFRARSASTTEAPTAVASTVIAEVERGIDVSVEPASLLPAGPTSVSDGALPESAAPASDDASAGGATERGATAPHGVATAVATPAAPMPTTVGGSAAAAATADLTRATRVTATARAERPRIHGAAPRHATPVEPRGSSRLTTALVVVASAVVAVVLALVASFVLLR